MLNLLAGHFGRAGRVPKVLPIATSRKAQERVDTDGYSPPLPSLAAKLAAVTSGKNN